nr:hypothetical protein [Xanthomonas arboricola pv. juglandis]MDN0226119.1 hypothetical protein [Xanthomonas arboricola pv. juglandis]MDN0230390.1 hypothetical protein [Xanthomonas arboricola pv. juglandis]MDN0235555.1 hypothetical protein [Xanthomonas arboricola pv. juglandis]MDN0239814.1 hypothetical protein [Xanthomonas arboricola pv. juglandis]
MATTHNPFLLVAGGLNALAALLHLGCIAAGPAGYRLLGAGDGMAQMASAGHWYPTVVTLIIVSILLVLSTPRNSMPAKTRGLRLMLITELGGR